MISLSQIRRHGLWCQVSEASNAGMGSNIGDWYYPSTDGRGFIPIPNSDPNNTEPYQSLKCMNQIGLAGDGDTAANKYGIVKCTTTVPNLDRVSNYWAVYPTNVFEKDYGA